MQRPVVVWWQEGRVPCLLLSEDKVVCHGPASRACESSALREGLLQNYYFKGFADLGRHPCNNNTLADSYPAYGSWDNCSLFLH